MVQFKTFFFPSLYSVIMRPLKEVNMQIESSDTGPSEVGIKITLEVLEKKPGDYEQFWHTCLNDKNEKSSVMVNQNCLDSVKFSSPKEYVM